MQILGTPNWNFLNISKLKFIGIFQIEHFLNFPNWTFFEFSKLNIFGTSLNGKFVNFPSRKLLNVYNFSNLKNQNLAKKLINFAIARPPDILIYSQFYQFSYLPINVTKFSQFLFPISVTLKFGHSAFERSLVFKFRTSAILKFYCLKL